jgi:hypothetical protein
LEHLDGKQVDVAKEWDLLPFRQIHSSGQSEVWLIKMDNTFFLTAEIPIPGLNQIPSKSFVKNDQVWVFVNLDDEMGFVRLSILDL